MTVLLEHLDRQLVSSRRLLQIVLDQSDAIRRQDVAAVLATLGDLQVEMANRQRLEAERDELLRDASARLGVAADVVELDGLLELAPAAEAPVARAKSGELRGLLAEVARVHAQNQVLIRQELKFLDHLMRVLSGAPQGGYSAVGTSAPTRPYNVVDARV